MRARRPLCRQPLSPTRKFYCKRPGPLAANDNHALNVGPLYQSAERITHRPVYRVMAGLGPATHDFADPNKEDVVGRPEPVLGLDPWAGHDTGAAAGESFIMRAGITLQDRQNLLRNVGLVGNVGGYIICNAGLEGDIGQQRPYPRWLQRQVGVIEQPVEFVQLACVFRLGHSPQSPSRQLAESAGWDAVAVSFKNRQHQMLLGFGDQSLEDQTCFSSSMSSFSISS
jgi:hypothetical protein